MCYNTPMEPKELLSFLSAVEPLKTVPRHCATSGGVPETVAAHSWRMAVMALLMREEFPELDMDKVADMCLIHDFGEAITGDIPAFNKTEQHEQTESAVLSDLVDTLPEGPRQRLAALFAEMDARETGEARLYKAIDRLEAVIQHNESDLSTWIPMEYELNRTYGTADAAAFPFLARLREQMRLDTEEKIRQGVKQDS